MTETSFIINPNDPEYKSKFEDRLLVEAQRIENRKRVELAEELLRRSLYDDDDTFNPMRFVNLMLEAYPDYFKTPKTDKGGDIVYRYDDKKGIFINDGIPFIEHELQRTMGEETATSMYKNTVKHLQVKTYIDREDFEDTPEIVVLENGCFNILSGELEPFNPHYNSKTALPVTYNPEATCPTFLKFLNEVLPNSVEFYQEWLGFHLLKDYRYQRVVVFLGDGDNGKSTLLNVQSAFLGRRNIAAESLFRLTSNRFSPAELYGKLANIAADVGPDELKYTGTIKELTGWDWISVEHKNRDPFQFRNHAKLTFSCNQLPRTPDETLAFFKRFIVLMFADPIPEEKQDKQLLEKLTTPEELSGIFNWAYEGLKRALERGRLAEPGDAAERKELYLAMSDPVTGFYNTHIIEDPEESEIKQDVITAFAKYCKNKGFIPVSDRKFVEQFKKLVFVRETQPTIEGARVRAWKGIKLIGINGKPAQDAQDAQGSQTQKKLDEKISEVEKGVHGVHGVQNGGSS